MRRTLLLAGLATLAIAPGAHAAESDLDPLFGTGGVAAVPFAGSDEYADVAVQPDGRLVAAGRANQLGVSDLLVSRFLPDGRLDPQFGTGGSVRLTLGTDDARARAVTLMPDGRIVAVGSGDSAGGGTDFAVVRLLPDGTPDPSFDGDGRQIVAVGAGTTSDRATGVALRGDKLVVTGTTGAENAQVASVRLTDAGALDATYCGTGRCVLNGLPGVFNALAATPGPGQTMLVAGRYTPAASTYSSVVRLAANGGTDPTFGTGGVRSLAIGPSDEALSGITTTPAGAIVATGWVAVGGLGNDLTVARLTPDGTADQSFGGGDGHVSTGVPGADDAGRDVAVAPDGRVVVAGSRVDGMNVPAPLLLMRFTPAGDPDPAFTARAVLHDGETVRPGGVVLAGERIVVAGQVTPQGADAEAALLAFADRPAPPAPPEAPAPPAPVPSAPRATPVPADTIAPVLRRVSVRGRTARFTLSEPARVTFVLKRRGARARTVTRSLAAGRRVLRLTRRPAPGRYDARLSAVDPAGNRSAVRRVRLRVR